MEAAAEEDPARGLLHSILYVGKNGLYIPSKSKYQMAKGRRPGGKKRGGRRQKNFKVARRAAFEARHLDQVWADVNERGAATGDEKAVGDAGSGPVGTTDRAARDEDLPGGGQFYCVPCSRYFVDAGALAGHERTKPHKRRVKELHGARPHSQRDADAAAGMGRPDNGVGGDRRMREGNDVGEADGEPVAVPMAAGFAF